MKKIILTIAALLSFQSFADTRSFDRTWLGVFGKRKIGETSYSVHTEGQARLDNDEFRKNQLLLRFGVIKKLDDTNEIALLYGFVETDQAPDEHRPTFQYSHAFFKNEVHSLSLRNRFEYRKREGVDAISGRYRGQLRYVYALEQKRSMILWDEPFLNMTNEDWTGNRVFERNRAFIGIGLPFQDTTFEVGYMNQYTPRTARTTIEHILTIYFFY